MRQPDVVTPAAGRLGVLLPEVYPEHELFIQWMKLKNTMRWATGHETITHLGHEYYD